MSKVHLLKLRIDHGKHSLTHPAGVMFTVELECPGVDDACRMYQACNNPDCDAAELERLEFDEGDDEPVLHGQRHRCIGGEYMTPTDVCFVRVDGNLWHRAEDLAVEKDLGAGDYRVLHHFGDEGEVAEFFLAPPEEVA